MLQVAFQYLFPGLAFQFESVADESDAIARGNFRVADQPATYPRGHQHQQAQREQLTPDRLGRLGPRQCGLHRRSDPPSGLDRVSVLSFL